MIMTIILSAVVAFFVVFMLGTIEPGKDRKPVPLRKKVEVYLIFLFLALCGIAYFYLKLISDGLL